MSRLQSGTVALRAASNTVGHTSHRIAQRFIPSCSRQIQAIDLPAVLDMKWYLGAYSGCFG